MVAVVIAAVTAFSGGAVATALGFAAGSLGFAVTSAVASFVVSSALSSAFGLSKNGGTPDFTAEATDRTHIIRSSVATRRVVYGEIPMSGPLVFAASTGSKNDYLHMVIPLACHECESIGSVYLNDTEITTANLDVDGTVLTGDYAGKVRIKKHLGSTSQTADTDLVSEVTEWTTDHRLRGVAYIYVRLQYSASVFPTGIPNIKAIVKGKKIYDPRTTLTAWSDNWALCVRDYLTSSYGLGASSGEINDASFISAANVSDENISIPDSGTQARYTCNGSVNLGDNPSSILNGLTTAGAGAVIYTQGEYKIYAGAYTSSVASLNEDDLRDEIKVRPKVSRKDLYNSVRGVYVSEDNYWQATDFPVQTSSTYVTQDGGETIYRDIQLPYTNNSYRAQRIAKIHLEKSRQGIIVEFPANMSALQLAPFDTVQLSIDRFGWSNKEFKIIGWQLSQDGGVDMTLQEESSASYSWSVDDATTVDAAPDTSLPDPFTAGAPTGLTFSEDIYDLYGVAILEWTSSDTFAEQYIVEYKLSSAASYTFAGRTDHEEFYVRNLASGDYDFRVRAVNAVGVVSLWTTVSGTISRAPVMERVSGLELFNSAHGTEFTGQDAKFTWRHSSQYYSYELGSEAYGGDSGGVDNYFRDYEVRIKTTGGTLLRTEHVIDNSYTYTFEKNKEDGGPNRSFIIEIYQRGRQGQLSAIPAKMTVSNPAPDAPSGLSVTGGFKAILVNYTEPTDTDFAGTNVWASTITGFTPGAGNLVYSGPGAIVVVTDLTASETYYVRVAAYDRFGTTGLNMSTEVSVGTNGISNSDVPDNTFTSAKIVSLDAGKINAASLSAIVANFGTVTAGKAQSSDGKMVIDLDNKYIYIE